MDPSNTINNAPRSSKWISRGVLAAVLACSAGLALFGLDHAAFWEDEAEIGIIARNFLKTGELTGWDGRNLYAYRNGTKLGQNFRVIDAPLTYLTCAGSFKIFGVNTWAGRFPFVLAGLAALAMLALLLHHDFGGDPWVWLYALGGVGFSPVFLLTIRQCRYYALCILAAMVIYFCYRQLVTRRRLGALAVLTGAAILMFYAHPLLCAAFLAALGVVLLCSGRKGLGRREWLAAGVSGAVFLAATLPYAVMMRIWVRPDIPNEEPWLRRHLVLLWWNFRDLNIMGAMPWVLAMGVAWAVFWKAKHDPRRRRMGEWALLAAANVFFISLLSPQPATTVQQMADVRYLAASLPLLLALSGLFLVWLHGKSRLAALGLFAIALGSNLLMLTWKFHQPAWLLPAYLREISHEYPTAYSEATRFLETTARPDDVVTAWPDNRMYPLMFYVGDRVRFGCQLYDDSPLAEAAAKLNAPLLITRNFPQWIILFGINPDTARVLEYYERPHPEGGGEVVYDYRHVNTFDVYCEDTQRPELPLHNFGPLRKYDLKSEAVYVFQRGAAGN